jgi:RimJ/RimL family protein N-acetyltransferase
MRHVYPVGMGYWSVIVSAKFVGWVLLTPLDLQGPEIEIGWRLVRSAWGLGYATEAARPILGHALTTLKIEKVLADIDPMNSASASVARKLGFRPTGSTLYDGRKVIRFAIERTDAIPSGIGHQSG